MKNKTLKNLEPQAAQKESFQTGLIELFSDYPIDEIKGTIHGLRKGVLGDE